jgi:hypothetical protein
MDSIKRPLLYAAVLCLLVPFTLCGGSDRISSVESAPDTLNETALLLAGKELARDSKIYPFTQTRFYRSYAEHMKTAWSRFQEPNLGRIKKWWRRYRPSSYSRTVL